MSAKGKNAMLTKSLHTVTAATNVALHVLDSNPKAYTYDSAGARALASFALDVLGHDIDTSTDRDPTVARIIANCEELLAGNDLRPVKRKAAA
jgi:hypothetical protein